MDPTGGGPLFSALIADDVPELRKLLRHVLEWSERFTVVGEAENGAEAVEMASQYRPDLLLLDISMPVMDGLEALPRIRMASTGTRVVILSGFEADRFAERARDRGAVGYLEKGVPPAFLVKQLLTILEKEPSDLAPPSLPPAEPVATGPVLDVSPEEMMSLVAHEVRNPLAVIQGFGSELQARWDTMQDEQRRDAVRRMTERARFLSNLVNNLMFLRRLEGDALAQHIAPQDLTSFVETIADELNELARGHPVRFELSSDLPEAHFDLVQLRQVVTNLLVNAAKFSPPLTPIDIKAFHEDGAVVLEVSDEGPGVPRDMREKIFEKFERVAASGSGIGLGLFISRSLVRSMGGDLWLEDTDKGATFRLRLRIRD